MKRVLALLLICAATAACDQAKEAPVADTAPAVEAAPAPAPAEVAAAEASPVQADLPQACRDYLDRVKACIAKTSGDTAASSYQVALNQAMTEWQAAPDKSALIPTCEEAARKFAEVAPKMRCE